MVSIECTYGLNRWRFTHVKVNVIAVDVVVCKVRHLYGLFWPFFPFAGDHDYTLTVENGGGKPQLDVSIKASTGLKANPTKLHLTKGNPLPVSSIGYPVEARPQCSDEHE